jgi:ABC-2 type transport system permease protein
VEKLNRFYPNIDIYIAQSAPSIFKYLPNQWVADFLYFAARGEVMHALPYAGILLSVTIIAFCVCILVASRFYYRSWLISLQIQSAALSPYDPARRHFLDFRSDSVFPPQVEALVKKEFFLFFRESSQWIHLIVMIILAALFSVSVSHLNLRLRVMDVQLLTYLVLFAFDGFMVSSLALRFVFPMIGLEGQTFWALKSSPIKMSKILMTKFVIGFLPVLIIAEYIAISSNVPFVSMTGMRPLLMWFGIFSAFWISLTMVALNLGFGGFFANYFERNPIRAASTQGATLTFLSTLVYLFMLLVIILGPVSDYFALLFRSQTFHFGIIVIPGTLLAVVSYILSVFGLAVGLKAVQRDF